MMVKNVEKLIGWYVPLALLFSNVVLLAGTRKENRLAHTLVMGQILSPDGRPVSKPTVQISQTIFRPDLADNNQGFSKVERDDVRAISDE